jgi:hypothetical protein
LDNNIVKYLFFLLIFSIFLGGAFESQAHAKARNLPKDRLSENAKESLRVDHDGACHEISIWHNKRADQLISSSNIYLKSCKKISAGDNSIEIPIAISTSDAVKLVKALSLHWGEIADYVKSKDRDRHFRYPLTFPGAVNSIAPKEPGGTIDNVKYYIKVNVRSNDIRDGFVALSLDEKFKPIDDGKEELFMILF